MQRFTRHLRGTFDALLKHRWIPVFADAEKKLSVMSLGFLVEPSQRDAAVVWRGPKKTGLDFSLWVEFLGGICLLLKVAGGPSAHISLLSS